MSAALPADPAVGLGQIQASDPAFNLELFKGQAVETFLANLTKSPDFEDATTTSEGVVEQGPTGGEITVACTARYVGTAMGADEPDQAPAGSKSSEPAVGAKAKAGSRGNAELTQNSHPGI